MTSEIVIMNKNVIVMAADSAVTVNNEKTYNGANKLFKLSDTHSMAMMIFGTATFGSISLESLIKGFVNKTDFEDLEDILKVKEAFLDYLNDLPYSEFDFKNKLEMFKQGLLEILEDKSEKDFVNHINNIGDYPMLPFLEDESLNPLFSDLKKELGEVDVEIDILKQNFNNLLLDLRSGIVIAGFNRNELLPSCISFDLITKYGNEIIIRDADSYIGCGENLILAFAQDDVIATFMLGMHVDFDLLINDTINDFLDLYHDYLRKSVENKKIDDEKYLEYVEPILDKTDFLIKSGLNKILMNIFDLKEVMFKQIINTISFLPVDELVKMAKYMIYITSLRRKFDSNLETVGGDIDVAILSNGDGFLWKEELLSR